MIRLFLVFIVIYVAFTAISLNYAKAFRIKNSVISFIEEKQITDLNAFFSRGNDKYVKELDAILSAASYSKECAGGNGKINTDPGEPQAYCHNGIILEETERTSSTITYAVHTYAGWNLGILNNILALGGQDPSSEAVIGGSWEINGEATVRLRNNIEGTNNKGTCYCNWCEGFGGAGMYTVESGKTKATCTGSCNPGNGYTGKYSWNNPVKNICESIFTPISD